MPATMMYPAPDRCGPSDFANRQQRIMQALMQIAEAIDADKGILINKIEATLYGDEFEPRQPRQRAHVNWDGSDIERAFVAKFRRNKQSKEIRVSAPTSEEADHRARTKGKNLLDSGWKLWSVHEVSEEAVA